MELSQRGRNSRFSSNLAKEIKHEETYCGDLVKLRSPSEILAPLDKSGVPGGLPFMPETGVSCARH